MSYSTSEIRAAMIQLGQKRGAEYSLCVVRDVIEAFKADVNHPVKDAVKACIAEKRESYVAAVVVDERPRSERVYATKEQVKALKHELTGVYGLKVHVARAVGLKRPERLHEYLSNRIFMSIELYNAIIEQLPKSKEQIIKHRCGRPHDYARYIAGCRCDFCRDSYSIYIKQYNTKRKNKQVAA